jgi:hypothetical protein
VKNNEKSENHHRRQSSRGKTIGEAKDACNLDLDEATGIIDENIHKVEFLGRKANENH